MKLVIEVDLGDRLDSYTADQQKVLLCHVFAPLHDDYAKGREERQHDADLATELWIHPLFTHMSDEDVWYAIHQIREVEESIENQLLDEVNKRDI